MVGSLVCVSLRGMREKPTEAVLRAGSERKDSRAGLAALVGRLERRRALTRIFMQGGNLANESKSKLKVRNARPSGKDRGEDCGVEGGKGDPLEHDPAEGDHLGDGADFA